MQYTTTFQATHALRVCTLVLSFVLLMSCNILHVSGWMDFADDGFSEWTCGGGEQVDTTWSHCRPAERGNECTVWCLYHINGRYSECKGGDSGQGQGVL